MTIFWDQRVTSRAGTHHLGLDAPRVRSPRHPPAQGHHGESRPGWQAHIRYENPDPATAVGLHSQFVTTPGALWRTLTQQQQWAFTASSSRRRGHCGDLTHLEALTTRDVVARGLRRRITNPVAPAGRGLAPARGGLRLQPLATGRRRNPPEQLGDLLHLSPRRAPRSSGNSTPDSRLATRTATRFSSTSAA